MSIKVVSASLEHGNYFKVCTDGKQIEVEGERGIGLVVLEKGTRKITLSRMFDTNIDPNEATKLVATLQQVKPGSTIIMGIKGEASRSMSLEMVQTIAMLGSNLIHSLSNRDSWAFIVRKGDSQTSKEVKDSHNAVELSVMKKPHLHHLLITSSSFDHGNNFSVTINDNPNNVITYKNDDQRGIVLVILDREGNVRMNQIFDTHESPTASDQLESTIQSVLSQYPGNMIILGIKEEGTRSLSTSLRRLIGSLGSLSIHQLGYRDSWCFIARLGKPQSTKELRDSHHSVTLSWVPGRKHLSSAPYTLHYHPPNPINPNPTDFSSIPNKQEGVSTLPPPPGGLVDYPVYSVHQKGVESGVGVGIGSSVHNRARRRETLG